jgi:hypothetical protein
MIGYQLVSPPTAESKKGAEISLRAVKYPVND